MVDVLAQAGDGLVPTVLVSVIEATKGRQFTVAVATPFADNATGDVIRVCTVQVAVLVVVIPGSWAGET